MADVLQLYTCAVCDKVFWAAIIVGKTVCETCKKSCSNKRKLFSFQRDTSDIASKQATIVSIDEINCVSENIACESAPLMTTSSSVDLQPDNETQQQQTSEEATDMTCIICAIDLSLFDVDARNHHVSGCLTSSSNAYSGIRSEVFNCVICDLNLSRRNITSRCAHLKRCAKLNNIRVKELLQMLSPDDEEEETLLEDDADTTVLIPSTTDKPVLPNAYSILMANAKLQNKPMEQPRGKSRGGTSLRQYTPPVEHSYTTAPEYKKIQTPDMPMPIVVDGFQYASSTLTDCYGTEEEWKYVMEYEDCAVLLYLLSFTTRQRYFILYNLHC